MPRGQWPEDKKLPKEKKHKCRTISICDKNYDLIKELGQGNFSKGIRYLLDQYTEEVFEINE